MGSVCRFGAKMYADSCTLGTLRWGGGCSEVAVATGSKAKSVFGSWRKQEGGRSGRRRKGQIRGEVGYGLLFFPPSRHVGCSCRIHSLIHIIFTGGTVWFGIYFRHFSCMMRWLSRHAVVAPPYMCAYAVVFLVSICMSVCVFLCGWICISVCVFGELGTGLKGRCLSVVLPRGPVWLGVDLSVQDGDVQSQGRSRRLFWLRKLLGVCPTYWCNRSNRVICFIHTLRRCDNENVFCLSCC